MSITHRYLPHTPEDRQELLQKCQVDSIETFLRGIPQNLRYTGEILPQKEGWSEHAIKKRFYEMFAQSRNARQRISFAGAGIYEHFCPSVVNHLTQRGEFLTTYTPYQPEMAQGTLQAMFEFQTMMCELFAMDISNVSHYDGSSALGEAAYMANRITGKKRILISEGVHPEHIEVVKTYVQNYNVEVQTLPLSAQGTTSVDALKSLLGDDVAAVFIQSPNFFGCLENHEQLSDLTHQSQALYGVHVLEPLSLGLIEPPGSYGADFVTGEGQSFGVPASCGGPFLGLFMTKKDFVRQMPGRLCGESVDAQGRRSFVLTLSTREQHIRREKATSNICSNQNLIMLWATIWLSLIGKKGFQELAAQNLAKTEYLKEKLAATGKVKIRYTAPTFNEFVVDLQKPAQEFIELVTSRSNVNPGVALSRFFNNDQTGLLIAVTELKDKGQLDYLCSLVRDFG